jgi:hypothetical protein
MTSHYCRDIDGNLMRRSFYPAFNQARTAGLERETATSTSTRPA